MQSILLDHCWVCGERFTCASPPGTANLERHHVIPRQAGGLDGPTVDICDHHHAVLHKIAVRMSSGKPHFDLVTDETDEHKKKIYWLAAQVYNAFQMVANDPNRRIILVSTLDRNQCEMIDRLKKIYPAAKSREAVIALALDALYRRHFI